MQEWPLIIFTLLIQLSVGSTIFTTFTLIYGADNLNVQEKWRVAIPAMMLAFIAGAAVGAAIGYFLNSDKKEEILNDFKEGASKLKNDIEDNLSMARELVDNFRKGSNTTTENEA